MFNSYQDIDVELARYLRKIIKHCRKQKIFSIVVSERITIHLCENSSLTLEKKLKSNVILEYLHFENTDKLIDSLIKDLEKDQKRSVIDFCIKYMEESQMKNIFTNINMIDNDLKDYLKRVLEIMKAESLAQQLRKLYYVEYLVKFKMPSRSIDIYLVAGRFSTVLKDTYGIFCNHYNLSEIDDMVDLFVKDSFDEEKQLVIDVCKEYIRTYKEIRHQYFAVINKRNSETTDYLHEVLVIIKTQLFGDRFKTENCEKQIYIYLNPESNFVLMSKNNLEKTYTVFTNVEDLVRDFVRENYWDTQFILDSCKEYLKDHQKIDPIVNIDWNLYLKKVCENLSFCEDLEINQDNKIKITIYPIEDGVVGLRIKKLTTGDRSVNFYYNSDDLIKDLNAFVHHTDKPFMIKCFKEYLKKYEKQKSYKSGFTNSTNTNTHLDNSLKHLKLFENELQEKLTNVRNSIKDLERL